MIVYTVGSICKYQNVGQVFCIYSIWSVYEKAKQEAVRHIPDFASAIVIQPILMDTNETHLQFEIINKHNLYLEY